MVFGSTSQKRDCRNGITFFIIYIYSSIFPLKILYGFNLNLLDKFFRFLLCFFHHIVIQNHFQTSRSTHARMKCFLKWLYRNKIRHQISTPSFSRIIFFICSCSSLSAVYSSTLSSSCGNSSLSGFLLTASVSPSSFLPIATNSTFTSFCLASSFKSSLVANPFSSSFVARLFKSSFLATSFNASFRSCLVKAILNILYPPDLKSNCPLLPPKYPRVCKA